MLTSIEKPNAVPADSPWWVGVGFGAVILAVGMLAAWWGFSLGELDEVGLKDPPPWPPGWVFWAVWIVLYPTLGVATWHVWRLRADPAARTALAVFAVHLLANLSWLPVVHATRSPLIAPVVMDLLVDVFVAVAVWFYARLSRPAVLWMVPYISWNVFTTVIKVWRLWLNA